MLQSKLQRILSVLKKRLMNFLKTSKSDTCSMTSLGRPLDVNSDDFHKIGL